MANFAVWLSIDYEYCPGQKGGEPVGESRTYTCTVEDTVEASTRLALNLKDFFFFPFLLAKKAAVSAAVSDMVAVGSSFPCSYVASNNKLGLWWENVHCRRADKTQTRDSFARLEMKQATQTGYELGAVERPGKTLKMCGRASSRTSRHRMV